MMLVECTAVAAHMPERRASAVEPVEGSGMRKNTAASRRPRDLRTQARSHHAAAADLISLSLR